MYGEHRAEIESNLARAHRALVNAKNAADAAGDSTLWLDLCQLEVEVTRLAENSLRGKARRPIRGQLQIDDAFPKVS